MLFQRIVAFAEFEINYYRPSYFGIEAERELSALVTAFQPRIHDPQMHGMEEGPYSGDGFLRGWNFGNVFSARGALGSEIATMAGDDLHAAWAWNYDCAERERRNPSCFVSTIVFFRVEGRPSRVAIWPEGRPVLLPRVEYVLVGRMVSGEKRFGLAPWSEVVDVVQRAGFDTTQDPLKLAYFRPPPLVATWVANVPLIELDTLQRLSADRILDAELIAAARESIERDQGASDHA
jgi:hypothetical protein